MPFFHSADGLKIAYHEWGKASAKPPVLLHHGFAASAAANWEAPGVVAALVDAGRKVFAIDARGHGESEKPHDKAFYGETKMSRDLSQLMDIVGAPEVDLAGYSMGGITVLVNATSERRIRKLIAGGIGGGVLARNRAVPSEALVEALLAKDGASVTGPGAAFRKFAESTGADLRALAAQAQAIFREPIALERTAAPTLVLVGDKDLLATGADKLAAAIPNATLKVVPGDHLSVVSTEAFRNAIVDFFAR